MGSKVAEGVARQYARNLPRRTVMSALLAGMAGAALGGRFRPQVAGAAPSAAAICSGDPGVALLLARFAGHPTLAPQALVPPPSWIPFPTTPLFSFPFRYPPNWIPQTANLTSFNPPQDGVAVQVRAPDGSAAFGVWFISGQLSPAPQQSAFYGLEEILGQSATTMQSCASATLAGQTPQAMIAITSGQALGVGWGWLAGPGNPGGYAMAASSATFAAVTRTVFLPIIVQFGCGQPDCAPSGSPPRTPGAGGI